MLTEVESSEPAKRMQVRFAEVAQEIAIAHRLPEETVLQVLHAYDEACKAALYENIIVEVLRDVRLELQPYFDARNNTHRKRLAVNSERSRLKRHKPGSPEEGEPAEA
jgi:hypothetical protein